LDSLRLTAVDKALLQQTTAHKRASKAARFCIALLGAHAEAAELDPDLQSNNTAGRALRALYEAQGSKKPRATKVQKEARRKREVERARRTFQEALNARAFSNQNRAFNELVDTAPQLAAVNAPAADNSRWRTRDGALRNRSGEAARRQARADHQRRVNSAPQLPVVRTAPAETEQPAAAPPATEQAAAATAPQDNAAASATAVADDEILDHSEEAYSLDSSHLLFGIL
jgi:hypothetical protein